ncbi:MAG: hypothetical protein Unbinned400contig1004_6 [Prokaryotic dsDNA virus sp.]|nr:MAG: hypothetical protein Unbinned400contig1004_6 [Prokaryotic dsDNA virus sp.]
MKYKAKASYKKLEQNDFMILSPQKHRILLHGGVVDFDPPKELLDHLQEQKPKKIKEEKNGN